MEESLGHLVNDVILLGVLSLHLWFVRRDNAKVKKEDLFKTNF